MKKIAIIGSTGSIGESTIKVAHHLGPDQIQITALAAHSNIDRLEQQAMEFQPELIAVYNETKALELQRRLPHIKVLAGIEGVQAAASESSASFIVSALSGSIGLLPTLAAIKAGKTIGLANKESLVSAGALVMSLAREKGVEIIPIDSEHSALFQCLKGENPKDIRRLIVTASGGPFHNMPLEALPSITVDQALRHPTWSMGPKITIDSSTLMNKGLEVIEARWLFDMPYHKIEVVIHPQSVIHSLIEYTDGSMMAQMSEPSMIIPIQYALTHPKRQPGWLKPFDFTLARTLEFSPPDFSRFKCLKLAFEAIKAGGSLPCYMNAANEVLVQRFLNREIPWLDIGAKLESLMMRHNIEEIHSVDEVLHIEQKARKEAGT